MSEAMIQSLGKAAAKIVMLERQLAEAVELRLKQAEEFDVIVAGHEERIKELESDLQYQYEKQAGESL